MLVETDAPYLAPVPYRGKRNEPGYTRYVVETIAKERVLTWKKWRPKQHKMPSAYFAWKKEVCYESSHCRRRARRYKTLERNLSDIETIETNGSAIDEETIALIQKALQMREVIVFTDPNYPGTRIRNIIQERVPGVKHAFIEREEAVRKDNHKSLGVGTREYRIYPASARIGA